MAKVFVEARDLQYTYPNSQLHEVLYIVESPEEYDQTVAQCESWGYGCSNCSSQHLAEMLNISEEELQMIAEALGDGKIIASRTLGTYWDGYQATEENTKLRLTGAAQEVLGC